MSLNCYRILKETCERAVLRGDVSGKSEVNINLVSAVNCLFRGLTVTAEKALARTVQLFCQVGT